MPRAVKGWTPNTADDQVLLDGVTRGALNTGALAVAKAQTDVGKAAGKPKAADLKSQLTALSSVLAQLQPKPVDDSFAQLAASLDRAQHNLQRAQDAILGGRDPDSLKSAVESAENDVNHVSDVLDFYRKASAAVATLLTKNPLDDVGTDDGIAKATAALKDTLSTLADAQGKLTVMTQLQSYVTKPKQ